MAELVASARRTNPGQKLRVSYGLPEKSCSDCSTSADWSETSHNSCGRGLTLGEEEPQAALKAGTMASHVQCTGPFLLWQSLHYVGVADACALSLQSCATLCSPMDLGHQVPLSTGFARQGFWCGLQCPPQGDLPDPRMEPVFLDSPEESLKATREIIWCIIVKKKKNVYFYSMFYCLEGSKTQLWDLIFFS